MGVKSNEVRGRDGADGKLKQCRNPRFPDTLELSGLALVQIGAQRHQLPVRVTSGPSVAPPGTSGVAVGADISDGMSDVGGVSDLYWTRLSGPSLAKSCRTLGRFDHDDFHQTLDFIHGLLTTNLYVAQ